MPENKQYAERSIRIGLGIKMTYKLPQKDWVMHQLQRQRSSIATSQQKCFHCHRIKLVDNRKVNLPVTPYSPVDAVYEVGNGVTMDLVA